MVSNTQSLLKEQLEAFSDTSRIWIWQAEDPLSIDQESFVQNQLDLFIPKWTSHNQRLQARGVVIERRFIVICLDQEVSSSASGCSIDSLTHAIQSISSDVKIDFFNRNVCYILMDSTIVKYNLDQISTAIEAGVLSSTAMVFDPLINSKIQLLSQWPKSLEESWHRRFI